MDLIDSHAHIDFPQFADDRDAMLERARLAGVNTIVAIGTGPGPEKLDAALPFAEANIGSPLALVASCTVSPAPSNTPSAGWIWGS